MVNVCLWRKNKELNDKLTIENISGFEGIITDDTNTIIGDSKQTTDLIATKAFISNGGDLKKYIYRSKMINK